MPLHTMAKLKTLKTATATGFSRNDKILETAGWFALATLVLVTVFSYFRLPDIIPVHFNLMGKPDRFGNKAMLFAVLAIAATIFLAITALIKYVFNAPRATVVPDKNLELAIGIIKFLKLMVMIGFIYIMVITNLIVDKITDGLGSFFLPATLLTMVFPIAFFFKRTMRQKLLKK